VEVHPATTGDEGVEGAILVQIAQHDRAGRSGIAIWTDRKRNIQVGIPPGLEVADLALLKAALVAK
jgi:hypothetical protein